MRFHAYVLVFLTLSGLLGPMLGGCTDIAEEELTQQLQEAHEQAGDAGYAAGLHIGYRAARVEAEGCASVGAWPSAEEGAADWTNNNTLDDAVEGSTGEQVKNGFFDGFNAAYTDLTLGYGAFVVAEGCCELYAPGALAYCP